ncbi:MAG TPA: hypothetical protein DDY57_15660, partial [Franconibacter pulveris]|nr:hypothetical protein [Franconibacter pulveris]
MVRLILILLGVDFLRSHWRGLRRFGAFTLLAGIVIFIDALDGVLYFPIEPFALLLLIEGGATLLVAGSGIGGQKRLRYVKGAAFVISALLILAGNHEGDLLLSLLFGTLFLADGALQIASAIVVRYPNWRLALVGGVVEVLIAVFFYQPWPTHYQGVVPYCLGLGLAFTGWTLMLLARRAKREKRNPAMDDPAAQAGIPGAPLITQWEGPPAPDEPALTVHVWTPAGTAAGGARQRPVISRYIAAVDEQGVISTGHAALASPEGVYISLYPAQEIDRSPDDFGRLLRATKENNVAARFLSDYASEAAQWCPSTRQVRIRNYSPARLERFWRRYRQDNTYNLTHRNCSSSVAKGLEAALEG